MFTTKILNMDRSIEFFEDDTIDTIRQYISMSTNIHHDRLFILIGIQLSRHYYKQDKRNWDLLFHRLSLDGRPIEREIFDSYCSNYRIPALKIPYKNYDRDEWMTYPEELHDLWDSSGEFTEYWIFGVEDQRSFCLPWNFSSLSSRIIAAEIPIPDNSKLFMSFYNTKDIKGFWVLPHVEGESSYFPLLKSITPQKLSTSQITLLENNKEHLKEILNIDPPFPKKTSILKAVWYVELVDTEIDHVRTRFEQMFYGLTVSKNIPCITFFTSQTEISRHKFFTENVKTKEPYLDLALWSRWWTKTKPPGSRPKLILYRGKSTDNFDRISISSTDISFAIYRDSNEKHDIEYFRESLLKWFESFDSIIPFFKDTDLKLCRWSLQEVKLDLEFDNSIEELDTKRLGCLNSIFDQDRKHPDLFKFMRSDYALEGMSVTELFVIELLKDNEFLTPKEVQEQLKISLDDSTKILTILKSKINDDPRLLQRKTRGFPTMQILHKSIIISSIIDIERPSKYASILRYILSDPKSKKLDKICPKKVETSDTKVAVSDFEYTTDDSFGDLFSYLEEVQPEQKVEEVKKTGKKTSKYSYFIKRLEEFDPNTFNPDKPNPDYPGACEQSHQPIGIKKEELETIPEEFDPRKNIDEKKILKWENPEGIIMCPEYWCMYDKIPLQKTQLLETKGILSCPVCGGKVRNSTHSKADPREFSVIPRTKGFSYAGYSKTPLKSLTNSKDLPCCFRTEHKPKTLSKETQEGKYYINRELITDLEELRLAYLPEEFINVLDLENNYTFFKKNGSRIPGGQSGYFRIGLGHSSKTLPELFKSKKIEEPRFNIEIVLNCSFLHLWTKLSDDYIEEIEINLSKIKPFDTDILSRKNVARMISGISKAFRDETLTPIQEVEYTCLCLDIDVYRINLETLKTSCLFYSQLVSGDNKILLLEINNQVDCLGFVSRSGRNFSFVTNFLDKPFTKNIETKLEELREKSCKLDIPTSVEAFEGFVELFDDNPIFIIDPFGRMQGLFLENTIIIPFKNSPLPTLFRNEQTLSYQEISDKLPTYDSMKKYLIKLSKHHSGYKFDKDIIDSENNRVEILLECGLHIPVKPEKSEGKPLDVITSIIKEGETEFTFGETNSENLQIYKEISYTDEIFNFILYELTKDLEEDSELREVISNTPLRKNVEPLLEEWFTNKIYFAKVDSPIEFISKIRKPCGQFKSKNLCENSHMCGWDGQCKIKIRDTLNKEKIFTKLLTNIIENSKTRYMILDGRTTPFFSTILYLELPHEKIITDLELKQKDI
jgi:hypothetical protein